MSRYTCSVVTSRPPTFGLGKLFHHRQRTPSTLFVTFCFPIYPQHTHQGFYDRSYCEVKNWHQSGKLVKAPRVWDALKARHPEATVFVNGLWHGMHDHEIDYFINVRPQYLQNGGKVTFQLKHACTARFTMQGS